jgi:UV DNA damage endonuclease
MSVLGYCCINTELNESKPRVTTNRSLTKKKFTKELCEERAEANVRDLLPILIWNGLRGIKVFRISSNMFPRVTCPEFGYRIQDMSNFATIKQLLKAVGDFAIKYGHKLSFHPGPYTCIASPKESVRKASIREIEMHVEICKLIDPQNKLDIPINIHVGGSYGRDFKNTAERFILSYLELSECARQRIVVENDDNINGWSVQRLYSHLYQKIWIPITFDLHHWKFLNEGDTLAEDFQLAHSTWSGRSMQVHYSEGTGTAHSTMLKQVIPELVFDYDVHIHLECKGKEKALIDYVTRTRPKVSY